MTTIPTSDTRQRDLLHWLDTQGCQVATMVPASEDASFRRYFRLTLTCVAEMDGVYLPVTQSLIAMDAPPAHEDTAGFVRIADAWYAAGVTVPRVYASDTVHGFALLEDLGHQSLLSDITATPKLADAHYAAAGAMLHQLQAQVSPQALGLPSYDAAFLRREMDLFPEWLWQQHLGMPWSADDAQQWEQICNALVTNALQQPQVTVHRDYHSRNLMVRDNDTLAMIDFQDAMHGPVCYDLASLLRDCYVAWPKDRVVDWARQWFDDCSQVHDASDAQRLRWFFLTGVQRQLKAAGIFARLSIRDGKHGYLDDIPRTLGYIVEIASDYPELAWLAGVIRDRCLPGLRV